MNLHIRWRRGVRRWVSPAVLALVVGMPALAWSAGDDAEIVLLVGRGDRRDTAEADWIPAAVSQRARPGAFVRTLANSQMGLLMPDRTQIRLNQNSQLQIKSAAEASPSAVRLNSGRAWSQARPQAAPGGSAAAPPAANQRITMETPSATMSIRGTDWEVEVGPDGRTQLVVLSGTVEMANEQGAVSVGRGEAAVAEVGKAPVKLVLVRPQTRVQWVSSWRPQPRRWLGPGDAAANALGAPVAAIERGEYAAAVEALRPRAAQDAAAAVLLADVLLHQGETAAAIGALTPHAAGGSGDARAVALLARALLRDDQPGPATELLAQALQRRPDAVELLLAQGELQVLEGRPEPARAAYRAVLARDPTQAEAWYGLGLIASEREEVAEARQLLGQSLQRDPDLSKATAELAAAETFAGNLAASAALLDALLQREPDNYVALTVRGINRLKAGATPEALEDFLRAGLIEPRYARAWLYSGVAFYRLGETGRAVEAFRRAGELDERDPASRFFAGIVAGDALDYGAAIDSARAAQERLPYLKSLNQLATDQKGSANLGSALADFGLEEWAGYYAAEAYSPYWAGSHLFLANRQTGQFNKNSELFKGFITDPTVFGASNRRSSLVGEPGHHGRVDVFGGRVDGRVAGANAAVNGLALVPVPVAYSLSTSRVGLHGGEFDADVHGRSSTLGLGIRPRHDFGLFAFVADDKTYGGLRSAELSGAAMLLRERRSDLGANVKMRPDNQLWLKVGEGRQTSALAGSFFSPRIAAALNRALSTEVIGPDGFLEQADSVVEQRDLQFRHAFTAGGLQWTWGAERSSYERAEALGTYFPPVGTLDASGLSVRATDVYASVRLRDAGRNEFQADLFRQRGVLQSAAFSAIFLPSSAIPVVDDSADARYAEWNARAGVKWQLAPSQSLRLVGQRWRRPGSVGTLSPIDTLGIPINDRLVVAGGRYSRGRLQYDGEVRTGTFVQAFFDHEQIRNGLGGQRSELADFELTQLENLLAQPDVFSPRSDLEDTPQFSEGRVRTLGAALNQLVGRRQAVSARYLWRDGRQSGARDGLRVPLLPRHYLQLGSQWSLPERWLLGVHAAYRGARFEDDRNLRPLSSGWSLGMVVYWESADKRSAVQAILENVLSRKSAGLKPDAELLVGYSYRF